ncbi:transposase [Streptomyces atratus]|uniref:transposase n=1 Tax=Streptomyces atratus TaxID=1893 RepID=UPI0036B2AABF
MHSSERGAKLVDRAGAVGDQVHATASLCTGCLLRQRCTKAKAGRILTIRPYHDLQTVARQQAATDLAWQADYRRWRPPVERAVSWLVHHCNRKLRYRGTLPAGAGSRGLVLRNGNDPGDHPAGAGSSGPALARHQAAGDHHRGSSSGASWTPNARLRTGRNM